jgi:hypothetical protein
MTAGQLVLIASAVSRAPEWIGRGLSSTNPALMQRAEEELAAVVAAAIRIEA